MGGGANLYWASFLVTRRAAIERALTARTGGERPRTADAEAPRRFRSCTTASLRRGEVGEPALDGLRVEPGKALLWVQRWCDAAVQSAGDGEALEALLTPLRLRFEAGLRGHQLTRSAKNAKPTKRRAVSGAIDRVADAFLAVDLDSGEIADANPAALALLGVEREDLLGRHAARHIDRDSRELWSERLESLGESGEGQRFRVVWRDEFLSPVAVDINAAPHLTRRRRLALVTARPVAGPA